MVWRLPFFLGGNRQIQRFPAEISYWQQHANHTHWVRSGYDQFGNSIYNEGTCSTYWTQVTVASRFKPAWNTSVHGWATYDCDQPAFTIWHTQGQEERMLYVAQYGRAYRTYIRKNPAVKWLMAVGITWLIQNIFLIFMLAPAGLASIYPPAFWILAVLMVWQLANAIVEAAVWWKAASMATETD